MKCKKLLSTLLATAMTISSFAPLPITANAETTEKKTMNFGSSVIANGDPINSKWDYIYYGNQEKWRVLSTDGNTTQNKDTTETATYKDDNGNKNNIGKLPLCKRTCHFKRSFQRNTLYHV